MHLKRTLAAAIAGAALAAAAWFLPAGAEDGSASGAAADHHYAGSREALFNLLAVAPDGPPARGGAPLLAYADLEAAVRAGYADLAPEAGLSSLPAGDAMRALVRLSAAQRYLQNFGLMVEEMPGLMGVGVADIHRELEFGTSPALGMVLGLDPAVDPGAAIGVALTARGFAERDVAGQTVWHRGEDGSADLAGRAPADPFGGDLGMASRIFLSDGRLAGSPLWPLAEAMVAASAGTVPSLADDPVIATAAHAASDPGLDGMLLQFVLLDGADTMPVPDALAPLIAGDGIDPDFGLPLRPEGPLPPYLMAALVDRFAGDRDEALVVLVYPDTVTAEQAATVLADRLAAYAPVSAPPAWRDRFADLDAVIEPAVSTDAATGFAAAVARISYRAVFPTDEPDDGMQPIGGTLFRFLIGALWRGELTPLMVVE